MDGARRRTESGEVVRKLVHPDTVCAVAWSPDGALIASGGDDKKVVVHCAHSGKLAHQLILHHNNVVRAIAWSPDGAQLASGGLDKNVAVQSGLTTDGGVKVLGHGGCVDAIAWSPDSTMLASGGFDNKVVVWDVESGE